MLRSVAPIHVADCGSMVLCRTLAMAQCLTVNLTFKFILMSRRSRMFMLSMQRSWALRSFGAVLFGWRLLFAERTEGFATSLLVQTAISICLEHRKQLLSVGAYSSIWSLEQCRDRCADQYNHSRSDPALINPLVMPSVLLVPHAP